MSLDNHSYDPDEVDERPRTSHFTRKDLRNLSIVGVLGIVLLYPVYKVMLGNSEKSQCLHNLKQIQSAILSYMENHDDHFPPLCMEGPNKEPLLFDGKPFTWASSIQEGMSKRGSFKCPSAHDDELVVSINPLDDKASLVMSYGMYAAWSAYPSSMITNIGQAVLISETSNHGTRDTYNPTPYKDSSGKEVTVDGFSIGWDVGNSKEEWQKAGMLSTDMPKSVTRLAFPGTKSGSFTMDSQSRHGKGIHVLFADGHTEKIEPPKAQTNYLDVGGELTGIWRTR